MADRNQQLAGKVAIITGASAGIGRGTTILFAQLGAQVALVGRNEEELKKTVEMCKVPKDSDKLLVIVADLSKEDDTKRIVDHTIENFGKLDILVNNAGMLEMGSIENTSMSQYDRVMNVNIRSIYQLTMLSVPHLIKTKGNIVNVSSLSGLRGVQNHAAYTVSKGALQQFTSCTAIELAPKQVRVNVVCPGLTITEMHKRTGMTEEEYSKLLDRGSKLHPLGRVGQPRDVAEAIAFLASDAASFITGACLPVDGGVQASTPFGVVYT